MSAIVKREPSIVTTDFLQQQINELRLNEGIPDAPATGYLYVRQNGNWVLASTFNNDYLRLDGTNQMAADIHANNHSIDECNGISNSIGLSNFYIALGPSIDVASDSSINLISALPVTVTSSNLDMNGNSIINVPQLTNTSDINILPDAGFNVVTATGYINCATPLNFGLQANGPNGVNALLFNYNDSTGEYCTIVSSDIQALFIDPRYANGGGAPGEPLQQAYVGFGGIYGIGTILPDARITCDGAISMTKQGTLDPSITSSCKLVFDAASTRLVESDDSGSYFLVTRKVLNELDDVTIVLPILGNTL